MESGFFWFHDSNLSHSAKILEAALDRSAFWLIDHPPYSADLAPCDFCLFSHINKIIRGRRFGSDHELISRVRRMQNSLTKEFFPEEVEQLIKRAECCIELGGDYVEKPQNEMEKRTSTVEIIQYSHYLLITPRTWGWNQTQSWST